MRAWRARLAPAAALAPPIARRCGHMTKTTPCRAASAPRPRAMSCTPARNGRARHRCAVALLGTRARCLPRSRDAASRVCLHAEQHDWRVFYVRATKSQNRFCKNIFFRTFFFGWVAKPFFSGTCRKVGTKNGSNNKLWTLGELRTGCLSILMFLTPLAEVTP